MESCELFSTLLNEKCDLIELKNDFVCVCVCLQSSINIHPFMQAFVVHHPMLTHLFNPDRTYVTMFLWRTNGEPKCKIHYSFYTKCLFMSKQIFAYKNLYALCLYKCMYNMYVQVLVCIFLSCLLHTKKNIIVNSSCLIHDVIIAVL